MDELRAVRPDIAAELERMLKPNSLEQAGSQSGLGTLSLTTAERSEEGHKSTIIGVPGFERLLLTKHLSELEEAIAITKGPVFFVNMRQTCCDAMVLQQDSEIHLPYSFVQFEDITHE